MWTPQACARVGDLGAGQALTDEQFQLLVPRIPAAKPGGRPRTTELRGVMDALFYLVRTGCQWRQLPPIRPFPPWPTVYGYFRLFVRTGVWEAMRHDLVTAIREQEGREANRVALVATGFTLGLTLAIVRRADGAIGFQVIPRRWVVERTFGWRGRYRRLSKDDEELPEVSEAMVTLAAPGAARERRPENRLPGG